MNAIEFVKKFGLEESAKIANESVEFGKNVFYDLSDELYYGSDFGGRICVNDLKQIVDAYEFVNAHGSVDIARKYISTMDADGTSKHYDKLRTFINLVEKCNA